MYAKAQSAGTATAWQQLSSDTSPFTNETVRNLEQRIENREKERNIAFLV